MESGNNTSKYLSYGSSFVAKMIFFTKGKGLHKDYLTSFELALRDAAISDLNLVSVVSIMPPECKIVTRQECFEKGPEVDANCRRLLGWDVLCWCSTVAKVWLCEYRQLG